MKIAVDSGGMKGKSGNWLIFSSVVTAALAARLYLLYTTQHFLDGDEALIGLMSKHIIELGEHPVFWYGIHYNGGGSWEAHLGALMMLMGGYSDYSVKFAALIISIILLIILYLWIKDSFGSQVALLGSFFYVFLSHSFNGI